MCSEHKTNLIYKLSWHSASLFTLPLLIYFFFFSVLLDFWISDKIPLCHRNKRQNIWHLSGWQWNSPKRYLINGWINGSCIQFLTWPFGILFLKCYTTFIPWIPYISTGYVCEKEPLQIQLKIVFPFLFWTINPIMFTFVLELGYCFPWCM